MLLLTVQRLKMLDGFFDFTVDIQRVSNLIKLENIDVAHFKHCNFRPYTINKILILSNRRQNATVKNFLLKNNLIKYECRECGQGDSWNGKVLILELDHINGNSFDNRLDNLRFLCSNCHSQTETNKGKNARKSK
jgi:ribosomal protein L44E